ncbi:hypothetical protein [Pseudomonas sp. Pseusp97]|uniref:hypothetical protein n=1 Tax=Pseudomonas sp. Pseusp97 TaxID=3243065 RepID=UPI0039A58410
MKGLTAITTLIYLTICYSPTQAEAKEAAEVIQLSAMSPKVEKHRWAWVRMGLKINNKVTPVEYEWRDGHVTISTVCRNANANLSYEDCMKAAKAIFGQRCKALNEAPYCEASKSLEDEDQ